MLLKEMILRVGNTVIPLTIEANQLGLQGWEITEVKALDDDEDSDVIVIEIYGEKKK